MKPKTRYTRDGDVAIAYQVFGDGPPDLVYSWLPASNVEHMWTLPLVVRYLDRLATFARVLIFDRRGMGLSDPAPGPPTLEQQTQDMRSVVTAAGLEHPFIWGESNASHVSALYAATHPDELAGLILYSSWSRGADVVTPVFSEMISDLVENNWGDGETVNIFAPTMAEDPHVKDWFGSSERVSAPPGMVKKLVEMEMGVDVGPVLPAIRVPTLVLHRRDDPMVPLELGRQVADAIPGAKFVELEGEDNMSFFGKSDLVLDEIEQFVTGRRHHYDTDRVLATVLFTDIVESTERAATLGDRRWRDLLDDHNARVRREVARFRGQEIRPLGDGFLAMFDGPARAIRCGCAIAESAHEIGLATRVGLHTGEVELLQDDLAGMAVHIGARVVAEARPGEVLVSGTVKDLVVGSGLSFSERGERTLKGVPGVWRLYAVER